ncbi:MAG: hypothetical protein F4X17_14980 [Gemmatimonadetes bacterium]|nr:hypothetical protein [Gemmatimonadota bacterium]
MNERDSDNQIKSTHVDFCLAGAELLAALSKFLTVIADAADDLEEARDNLTEALREAERLGDLEAD